MGQEAKYRVITSGTLRSGYDLDNVLAALAKALPKVPPALPKALAAGRSVVWKHDLGLEEATKFCSLLGRMGLDARLEEEAANPSPSSAPLQLIPQEPPASPDASQESPLQAPGTCPKCGYQARDKQDPLFVAHGGLGECPRCGVIPRKPLAGRRVETSSEPSHAIPVRALASTETIEHTQAPTASIKDRFLARLITGCYLSILIFILLFIVEIAVVNAIQGKSVPDTLSYLSTAQDILSFFIGVLVINETIIRPTGYGTTRGGVERGLVYINENGQILDNWRTFALRAVGDLLAAAAFPLLLMPLLNPRRLTLADKISHTRPIQIRPPQSSGIAIFFIALFIGLTTTAISNIYIDNVKHGRSFSDWMLSSSKSESPPNPEKLAEFMASRAEQQLAGKSHEEWIRQAVDGMEEVYFQENGRYTDDVEALHSRYGHQFRGAIHSLLTEAIINRQVHIQLTPDGYQVLVNLDEPPPRPNPRAPPRR